MTERIATVDGVRICFETFGDDGDPAVLLLSGMGQTMDAWEPGFCERLAAEGRYVVRFDHRDAGRSASSPVGAPDYGVPELDGDPLRVLDALGVAAAHLVGLSMGAGIALTIAVSHPDRVRSLTPIGCSPLDDGLPPPDPALAATFSDPAPEPDWSDAEAVVAYLVENERPFGGPGFDADRTLRVARATVGRTASVPALLTNHGIALGNDDGPSPRPADVTVPTLVLHGSADPLFPLPHGEALAAAIPGAEFHAMDGVGHETPPPRTWDVVVPLLARHTGHRPST
ncbi:alpha/beta fold hydrolase [Pseudonocardia endophytica]|uniref:Pimeloyl-ACP methyl ester carboxylesterase n=1 Tax=Pseudonocardia endophytica TaxID=401976 RepID=A0A4V6NDD6_PSEEN|nr:alpha/beta hydrolase [Pseudonocardia endophytica]TCK20386.1 pimeloyl-ACP methyl ester carboxylesterase [Pseudonocardia endophytica]